MKKIINGNKTSFIKSIRFWGVLLLTGISSCIVAVDIIGSFHSFNFRADQMREDYITTQKQTIKQEVNRVVDLIYYENAQSEILTKRKIKSRVYEGCSVAQNIYQQNKTSKSKTEIQQMIVDVLRSIRFENETGYYFVIRMDGIVLLNANNPELEGRNLLDLQDTHGKNFIKEMIKIARQSSEGFDEYYWAKPGVESRNFKKISFIKIFEPYRLVIGAGLYVDDVEKQIKNDLLATISRIRFGKEGYIFINRLNGDALVSNGKRFSGRKKLWEVFDKNPEKTKDIFNKEYRAALKPEGDYIYYSWIKLTTSNTESPKASFIFGIPELQWLIGAGVYLDDVETSISLLKTKLNNQIKVKIIYFIIITAGIVAFFLFLLSRLNHRLKKDYNQVVSFFGQAASSDKKINRQAIKFSELDQMAKYANKMMADRKKAEGAMQESEVRFRELSEMLPEAVFETDRNISLTFANRRAFELFGYSDEDILRGLNGLDLLAPGDRDRAKKNLTARLKGKAPKISEYQAMKKDGSVFPILFHANSIMKDGELFGLRGIIIDITDRKQLESKLQQAQKMESIGTLAGGIAHDFNNILSAVIGYTELALDVAEKDSNLENNLQEVFTAGIRAKDLVKQILTFARQTEEEVKPVSVKAIAKETLKFLRSSIPTTIEVSNQIASDSLVMGDPTKIHQVFMNLCTNATQAMEDRGGVLEVGLIDVEMDAKLINTAGNLKPGAHIKLWVADTGSGISPDIIESIFDPYFTTKAPGEGTGMGLAMVHGSITKYGGDVTVESDPGKGTIFTVYLPIIKTREAHRPYQMETHPSGTERVLLVDDELPIAKMNGQILERLGYQTTVRSSSVEALELFRAMPDEFDLVITDMTMPNMTGDVLAAELITIRPGIPIILCTGYSKTITDDSAKEIGIKAFVRKPIVKAELAKTVRKVLGKEKGSNHD